MTEARAADGDPEERFLVVAPIGRDAALTCQLLGKAGMQARACANLDEMCDLLERDGAAGLLIAQEVLTPANVACLTRALAAQESWSDLPLLLFMGAEAAAGRMPSLDVLAPLGNVTLLERPVRPVTMQSAASAALRARRRQYVARAELRTQQDAIRQRDQFLAMLGHELRNPLGAIVFAGELLGKQGADLERARTILRRQTAHLVRLVDDLLDVSRVTSGKIALERGPVDLGELVARSLQVAQTSAFASGLTLALARPAQPVIVDGDAVRLEQIVANLVQNAIKYTPAGGRVDAELVSAGAEAVLRIVDTGVGIASDMLPRVFELFAQAHGTLDRSQGGMGIGLTLVRSLVELHGGRVDVRSEGAGRGTELVVHLPLATAAPAAVGDEPSAPAVAAVPHEVLVVEDNVESRELLIELLADRGHHVAAAADGPSGVALALAHRPAVALIDIGLPGLDGYGVAREVRAALGSSVYLVAMTGYGQPDDRRRATEAGFDMHLTKPVDIRALYQLLRRPDLASR